MRCLAIAVLALLASSPARSADCLFDPDPGHVWNRLHRFLYVRTYGSGQTFACDGLEAPLGRAGRFLIDGPTHREVIALLDEFLRTDAEKRIKNPLKRALLQRDLWYVFDKLAETTPLTLDFQADPADRQPERRAVGLRLAQVMRRLELSEEEIRSLPDNYAAAVRSGVYPSEFDPRRADRPFLPADLLAPDSPWIEIDRGTTGGGTPAAAEHSRKTEGRALFLPLLRLPGGRQAAKDYVYRLRPGEGVLPLPPGAMVALVRRTVLVNDKGRLQETRLTEGLEMRTFPGPREQHYYAWSLDRAALLSGKAGGLRALKPDDSDPFHMFLGTGLADPFERGSPPALQPPLRNCFACHPREAGIFSINTFGGNRNEGWQGAALTSRAAQAELTFSRKQLGFSWGLLQGMREAK